MSIVGEGFESNDHRMVIRFDDVHKYIPHFSTKSVSLNLTWENWGPAATLDVCMLTRDGHHPPSPESDRCVITFRFIAFV